MSSRGRIRKSVVQSVAAAGTRTNMKTTASGGRIVVLPKKREFLKENVPDSGSDSDENDAEKEIQRCAKLEDYTNMVREKCVLTDRWMVYNPQHDPSKNQKASLVVEMDKTVEGELRVKRCVKVRYLGFGVN